MNRFQWYGGHDSIPNYFEEEPGGMHHIGIATNLDWDIHSRHWLEVVAASSLVDSLLVLISFNI